LLTIFTVAALPAVGQTPDLTGEIEWTARGRLYAESSASHRVVRQLNQSVNYDGIAHPEETVGEALCQLAKIYDWNLTVFEDEFAAEGVKDVLNIKVGTIPKMQGVPLDRVLRAILARIPSPADAVYLVRRDGIEVTTRKALKKEGNARLQRLLDSVKSHTFPTYEDLLHEKEITVVEEFACFLAYSVNWTNAWTRRPLSAD
jgi:hypothetical protein